LYFPLTTADDTLFNVTVAVAVTPVPPTTVAGTFDTDTESTPTSVFGPGVTFTVNAAVTADFPTSFTGMLITPLVFPDTSGVNDTVNVVVEPDATVDDTGDPTSANPGGSTIAPRFKSCSPSF